MWIEPLKEEEAEGEEEDMVRGCLACVLMEMVLGGA